MVSATGTPGQAGRGGTRPIYRPVSIDTARRSPPRIAERKSHAYLMVGESANHRQFPPSFSPEGKGLWERARNAPNHSPSGNCDSCHKTQSHGVRGEDRGGDVRHPRIFCFPWNTYRGIPTSRFLGGHPAYQRKAAAI